MRYLGLGLVGLFLAGCALPLPFQIASWAVSGISYATTGKSMSDHALSAVASRDCALHRFAFGEDICFSGTLDDSDIAVASRDVRDDTAPVGTVDDNSPAMRLRESMINLAESLDDDLLPAAGAGNAINAIADGTSKQLDTVLLAMAETLNDLTLASGPDDIPDARPGNSKHYLIIGRYRQFKDAEHAQTRHAALPTAVRMVLDEGTLLYQVTAGPFSRPDALELGASLASKEDGTPRVALLCADRASTPPCAQRDAPVQLTAHNTKLH